MLALILVVLVLYFVLKSVRIPDWLAAVIAVGAAFYARPYMPTFDILANGRNIAFVIGGLVLLPYWLGPILIHATQRSSASPKFDPYDPARHVVPPSINTALGESEAALVASGFTKVGDFFQVGFMKNMTSRVGLFEKPATRQQAIIAGMYMDMEPTKLLAHYVEIYGKFTDGRTLLVNNSPVLSAYAPVAGKTSEQFPDVRDPKRLVVLHERLLKRMGPPESRAPIDRSGDAAAYLSKALVRELESQIPTGYLRLDRAANAYRPTIKGALVMTWGQLPPVSTIRKSRMRRRAAELMTSLGVTGTDASPATVPTLQKKVTWPAVAVFLLVMVYVANADTGSGIMAEREAARPMAIPLEFTVPEDFPGAVKSLEELTGVAAEQLVVMDSLGVPTRTSGAKVGIPTERADALLLAAQATFLERGFFLFRHEPNYGIGGAPDDIGLVPLADQFAVVQLVGTNGINFDLRTSDVISWLRELERETPFILTGIGDDHIEGRFLRPVGAEADALAKRFHAFCPDVVDQGTGSVKELANEIGRLNTFFCWWD